MVLHLHIGDHISALAIVALQPQPAQPAEGAARAIGSEDLLCRQAVAALRVGDDQGKYRPGCCGRVISRSCDAISAPPRPATR